MSSAESGLPSETASFVCFQTTQSWVDGRVGVFLFAPDACVIVQAAGRRVAYHTFSHVLDLDINFHLERRTGALSRILERGEPHPCHDNKLAHAF